MTITVSDPVPEVPATPNPPTVPVGTNCPVYPVLIVGTLSTTGIETGSVNVKMIIFSP